jgi:hypothetical protein
MVILLAGNANYKKGNDFPLLTVPVNMEGATNQSLKDFQWWAYSADFQKWLKANPREWVADSESTKKYSDIASAINEALKEENKMPLKTGVVDYASFLNSDMVFEAGNKDSDDASPYIKLHYAYNRLITEGKLEENFVVASQKVGDDKAVFLCLKDQSGNEVKESLTAYRMTPVDTGGAQKIRLFRITETVVGGPVSEDETTEGLVGKVVKNTVKVAALSGLGLALFSAIKGPAATFFEVRAGLKGLKYLRDMRVGSAAAQGATQAAKGASLFGKAGKGMKSLFGGAVDIATFKNTRTAIKDFSAGAKWVKGLRSLKTGEALAGKELLGASLKYGAKGAAEGGAKLIPFVGEVLLATEIVGDTWNWFSGNQAPRLGEVESFAKDNFDPKSIPVGKPITVCWSQPAGGGWGTAVSFLFNNDTRTTMEIVKIMENKGKSIFILNQINSKELQQQIAKHEMTLLAFENSHKFERGFFDNDDLEFQMLAIDGLSKIGATTIYEGSCSWNDFIDDYNKSSDKLLIVDPSAPEDYNFYYDDGDGEMINVAGKLVTNDDLSKYGPSDMQKIFGVDVASGEAAKPQAKQEVSDSLSAKVSWNKSILESNSILTKFSDFERANEDSIFEDESDKSVPAKADNSESLSPDKMTDPAKIAVYLVTEKDYANPDLRGKYDTGNYTNFVVRDEDFKAKDGAPIGVELNTPDHLENTRRGIYTYKKPEEKKVEKTTQGDSPEENKDKQKTPDTEGGENKGEPKKDDYYITASPDDIEIKNRKSSSIVRDNSVKDGINLFDKLLTPKQKEILGIQNWKTVTFAKELLDNRGDVTEVKLKNKYASFGDKARRYRVVDGEAFEIAKKFVEDTKDRIKYE